MTHNYIPAPSCNSAILDLGHCGMQYVPRVHHFLFGFSSVFIIILDAGAINLLSLETSRDGHIVWNFYIACFWAIHVDIRVIVLHLSPLVPWHRIERGILRIKSNISSGTDSLASKGTPSVIKVSQLVIEHKLYRYLQIFF